MSEETKSLAVATAVNSTMSFDTAEGRSELKLFAEALALRADITPKRFRGKEKVGNCMLALDMAQRMGVNPLMVMKNLYDVNGEPAWKAEFLIARVNQCGRFTSLEYEWDGVEHTDAWRCRAFAVDRGTGNIRHGSWISLKMAKEEGWYGKNGSKWKTMPEQMMMYRAGAFWQRTHAPELSLGLPTYEELEDMGVGQERRPLGDVLRGNRVEQVVVITEESPTDSIRERASLQGVSREQLEAAVGRSVEEWTDQDVSDLGDMLTKIESGVNQKDEVFP